MKRCPFCAEEIQDAAVVCRFCQRDLVSTAVSAIQPKAEDQDIKRRNQQRNARWLGVASVAVLFLFALLAKAGMDSPEVRRSVTPNNSQPVLELRSALMRQSSRSHMTVEGEVVNISGESLKYVTAVITWRDASGEFITSDKAIIEYNPVLPGQTSPFKVISTRNPEMDRFDITFRLLSGPDLSTRDARGYR
jgi:hypothetical protein